MRFHRLALALLIFLTACGIGATSPSTVTVLDGGQIYTVSASTRIPADLFIQAGLSLGPNDRALFNGMRVPLDQALPAAGSVTLQLRRAVTLTLVTPDGQRAIQSAAWTVGEALHEAGIQLYASDKIDPPAETPITVGKSSSWGDVARLPTSRLRRSRKTDMSKGLVT